MLPVGWRLGVLLLLPSSLAPLLLMALLPSLLLLLPPWCWFS
jgi:hypothetical protein